MKIPYWANVSKVTLVQFHLTPFGPITKITLGRCLINSEPIQNANIGPTFLQCSVVRIEGCLLYDWQGWSNSHRSSVHSVYEKRYQYSWEAGSGSWSWTSVGLLCTQRRISLSTDQRPRLFRMIY